MNPFVLASALDVFSSLVPVFAIFAAMIRRKIRVRMAEWAGPAAQ